MRFNNNRLTNLQADKTLLGSIRLCRAQLNEKIWRGVTFFVVALFGVGSWHCAGWCGCWGWLGWRGCLDVYDKGSHFLVSHFLEWGVGLMGVGVGVVVGMLMGFGVVCLWIYCLEVFAIGVTLFWSHFFVQIFYEYIVWKGLLLGVTLSDVALHWVYEFHWISKLIEFMDLRSH